MPVVQNFIIEKHIQYQIKSVLLSKIDKHLFDNIIMFFANKIRNLREKKKIPQRQLVAELEIDIPIHNLQHERKRATTLWLADQIKEITESEKEIADKAMKKMVIKIS